MWLRRSQMRLSAPIFRLKRKARLLARRENIALSRALDRIASTEGFQSWGQLASFHHRSRPEAAIFSSLKPGEMLLLAARPGQGKTVLGLQLLSQASAQGFNSVFLSSEFSHDDVQETLVQTGVGRQRSAAIDIELSDNLCAEVIIERLSGTSEETIAVVDYLQVLDQRRVAPELADQVAALRKLADTSHVRLVFLSQIHRSYDPSKKSLPDVSDIRLPNPVDLSVFDKGCFLHNGEMTLCSL